MYLRDDLEPVQKKALAITYPHIEHYEALTRAGFAPVSSHNQTVYV